MKYINFPIIVAVTFAAVLGGCSSGATRESAGAAPAPQAGLVPTAHYLPVRELNEAGLPVRYQPSPSPYSKIEMQIDGSAVENYIEARRAFDNYDFERAEQLLKKLQREEPQLSGPVVLQGDIALARGELQAAVDHYQKALAVNRVNFNAWVRLARAQRMQGKFQEAQNTYANALQQWPDGAELHWNLGVLYDVYLNMPEKAQAHMEAYQFLSGDNSGQIARWLEEIRSRTGIDTALAVRGQPAAKEASGSQSPGRQSPGRQSPGRKAPSEQATLKSGSQGEASENAVASKSTKE